MPFVGRLKAGPGCVRSIDHIQRPSSGPDRDELHDADLGLAVEREEVVGHAGEVGIAIAGAGPGETRRRHVPSPSPALT